MGYTTNFTGKLKITPVMNPIHRDYLNKFSETRRMKRDPKKLTLPDPVRDAVMLPLGKQCDFFVGGLGWAGQDIDNSVIDNSNPPDAQPGLWCQWEITKDGRYLKWDGSEKFYHYIEWLKYWIDNFLVLWGYSLTGTLKWRGEDRGDEGVIKVNNNIIEISSKNDKS